jgi:hypothetical protein
MLLTTLCTRSMIAFACELMVVTYSWFGFNVIVIFHTKFFKLTFKYSHIFKDNKLRSLITCQPGATRKIWVDVADLFVTLTISNEYMVCCWLYLYELKHRMCFGWCAYCKRTHQILTDHSKEIQYQILLFWLGEFHISCMFNPFLSFDIIETWKIINQYSKSCVKQGHVMIFLIVVCVLVCPRWSKYS